MVTVPLRSMETNRLGLKVPAAELTPSAASAEDSPMYLP
jgi:hypothetical protein